MQPELPFDGLPHYGKPARPIYVPPPIDPRALRLKRYKERVRAGVGWIVSIAVLAKQANDVIKGLWALITVILIAVGAVWYFFTGKKEPERAEPERPGIGNWKTDTFRDQ